jgi:putative NADPH-quinone reductase
MKKILIINGHPIKGSFNEAIVESYKKGALENKNEIKQINIGETKLENYLRYNHYDKSTSVGEDIKDMQKDITWADHLVIVHPVWWGGMPAILKCFFDTVFESGFAFRYKSGSPMPEKLLKGKTAHIITTLDTPIFIYKYLFGAPSVNQLKSRILKFCGISPVKVNYFGPTTSSTEEERKVFIEKIYNISKSN